MKTKLGLSAGLLAAITYLCAYFGGYIPLILIIAYILLVEKNDWLSYVSVKSLCLLLTFSVTSVIISLIPDALAIINSFIALFNSSFSYYFITRLETFLLNTLSIVKVITFALLAFKALTLKDVSIPFVDKFVSKHSI